MMRAANAVLDAGTHLHTETTLPDLAATNGLIADSAHERRELDRSPSRRLSSGRRASPSTKGIGDAETAQAASSAESAGHLPSFPLALHTKGERRRQVFDLPIFATDSSDQGTAVFYDDGYY